MAEVESLGGDSDYSQPSVPEGSTPMALPVPGARDGRMEIQPRTRGLQVDSP